MLICNSSLCVVLQLHSNQSFLPLPDPWQVVAEERLREFQDDKEKEEVRVALGDFLLHLHVLVCLCVVYSEVRQKFGQALLNLVLMESSGLRQLESGT